MASEREKQQIITELDKKLRDPSIAVRYCGFRRGPASTLPDPGDFSLLRCLVFPWRRCRAVAGFANVLKGQPSTEIINSVFLKLGDAFGAENNNLLRYFVLRVFHCCRKELVRVLNVEVLVKKVKYVFDSNDPAARSLAIRAYACMAELLVDNLRVHSDVHNALRSPNAMEVRACIRCVHALARVSGSFAENSLPIISKMIQSIETPNEIRAELLLTLGYMHRNPTTALAAMKTLEVYAIALDHVLSCAALPSHLTCTGKSRPSLPIVSGALLSTHSEVHMPRAGH